MTLEEKLWKTFNKALGMYQLIDEDDKILVGLSGGKDSLCLLEFLARRSKVHVPRFTIEALHVRMENVQYETDATYLHQFCAQLGVPLHIITTRFTPIPDGSSPVPDGSAPVPDGSPSGKKPACFLCSWQRRKQLFNLAQELGCTKIALGHHQDDLIHTALMNLTFQGHFSTMPPLLKMKKMPLTIIRPLCLCQESDIVEYAKLKGYRKQLKQCPYEHETNRTVVHQLFETMQQMNKEARYSIWNAIESVIKTSAILMLLITMLSLPADAKRRKHTQKKAEQPTEQSERLQQMTMATQRITFIDSILLPKRDVLHAYHLSTEAGQIAPYSTFFPKKKSKALTFMNALHNRCFFSTNDSILYSQESLLHQWSSADSVAGINTTHQLQHINYPFMLSDGLTLYFAAQGPESIGGYDIFMTTYDTAEGRFLKPENIGMPFNSTANDYLFVIDEFNQLGFFATDRACPESDSVCVYTFIPAEKYQSYDTSVYTPEQIVAFANITDISKTWEQETTREAALQRLQQIHKAKTEKLYAFSFIINDAVVYHQLSDFKAAGNQKRYQELTLLRQRYQQTMTALEKARNYYVQATKSEKDELTREILDNEQIQHELFQAIRQQEKQIRQLENNYLIK